MFKVIISLSELLFSFIFSTEVRKQTLLIPTSCHPFFTIGFFCIILSHLHSIFHSSTYQTAAIKLYPSQFHRLLTNPFWHKVKLSLVLLSFHLKVIRYSRAGPQVVGGNVFSLSLLHSSVHFPLRVFNATYSTWLITTHKQQYHTKSIHV